MDTLDIQGIKVKISSIIDKGIYYVNGSDAFENCKKLGIKYQLTNVRITKCGDWGVFTFRENKELTQIFFAKYSEESSMEKFVKSIELLGEPFIDCLRQAFRLSKSYTIQEFFDDPFNKKYEEILDPNITMDVIV